MGYDSIVNGAIGRRLRSRREAAGLTRERLAEYADISVQFLADIETGRKGMTVQTLRKLALALHCSCDDLIFGEDARREGSIPPALALQLSSLTQDQASLASDILALVKKALPHNEQPPTLQKSR
ncbi:MAG TPA: helix-turn-helix domain-containing protein [Candidatus Gemmiger faecigallinarum]|nr:helix-turn-helix domain-containing protein [Candidatus Gemmiger faecigallinarum]